MSFDAIAMYRVGRAFKRWRIPVLPAVLRKAIFYLHNTYLPTEVEIGAGTQLGYGGMGVVIHKDARIGRNCLISQQVTIGGRKGEHGAPLIGDFVRIGAGAKILGPIRIGDFAVIGANAVVLKDVASGAVMVGVPAREIRREEDPMAAYVQSVGLPDQESGISGRRAGSVN
jgi:serine O-acetyltransferase